MKIATPWAFNKELQDIFKLLDFNARFVGGCVRDLILFNELVYDIDIATPFLPQEVIQRLNEKFHIIPTGLKHGTVTIVGKNKYEITTLRKDEITNGRHAQVAFNANWEEDSSRRDFTINALYADFDGNVYDFHNGLKDLELKQVRFIGNASERICEDYLRILRFFRFSMRFGSMEKNGLDACLQYSHKLMGISKERIALEWFKIIQGSYFWQFLNYMLPVLEALHFKTDVKKKINLTPLGISAMFLSENSHIALSNYEKKYIYNLKHAKLNNLVDAILLERKFGKEFISNLMILHNKHFNIPELGEFPLKGAHLITLGFSGKQLGDLLNDLYLAWVQSMAHLSLNDLLEIAKEAL